MKKNTQNNLELIGGIGMAAAILAGAAYLFKKNNDTQPAVSVDTTGAYTSYAPTGFSSAGAISNYYGLNYTTGGASGSTGTLPVSTTGGTANTGNSGGFGVHLTGN